MRILESSFGDDISVESGVYGTTENIIRQQAEESDRRIHHFRLRAARPRWSCEWFAHQSNKYLNAQFAGVHAPIQKRKNGTIVALEIGGDNYSLDYGIPGHFLEMDRYLQSLGIPVVLWGASVGPFDGVPQFKDQMLDHLRSLTAVFARESSTVKYLADSGVVRNVHHIADPAFLLQPQEPSVAKLGRAILPGTIGLNFSPLLVKYFREEQKPPWEIEWSDLAPLLSFCTEVVTNICRRLGCPIVLIPHACSELPGTGDCQLLAGIQKQIELGGECEVRCLPESLNAREMKWAISQCDLFVGARTHSTIAAFSSCIPTISLSYSMKARGINQDVFGTQKYCLDSSQLTVDSLVDSVVAAYEDRAAIRSVLAARLPAIRESALNAGVILRSILA